MNKAKRHQTLRRKTLAANAFSGCHTLTRLSRRSRRLLPSSWDRLLTCVSGTKSLGRADESGDGGYGEASLASLSSPKRQRKVGYSNHSRKFVIEMHLSACICRASVGILYRFLVFVLVTLWPVILVSSHLCDTLILTASFSSFAQAFPSSETWSWAREILLAQVGTIPTGPLPLPLRLPLSAWCFFFCEPWSHRSLPVATPLLYLEQPLVSSSPLHKSDT